MSPSQETINKIEQRIDEYRRDNLKLFLTSSFQTHSIPLLHIISRIDQTIPVYFLNTGYHFPETLQFRDEVTELLDINVKSLISPISKHQQKDNNGRLMVTSNPDYSSYMNKILPMKPVLAEYDVWISGVRKVQSENRSRMTVEEQTSDGVLRYHPILDWSNKMIWEYRQQYNLPEHPLQAKGYVSIGNEPNTLPAFGQENARDARWQGMNKTECGLHTNIRK